MYLISSEDDNSKIRVMLIGCIFIDKIKNIVNIKLGYINNLILSGLFDNILCS